VPEENDLAPDFELPADDGSTFRLSEHRGRKVVLYFYPKDDTPGCTAQACDLRDHIDQLEARNAVVVGVSPDSVASHQKFRGKYSLPFRLLADTDHEVAEAYGVWGEKTFMGRKYMGNHRTTFVIDEEGRIAEVFRKVDAKAHREEVLAVL
jgi:thioredoxin-dependent peroxiredoxin